LSRKLTAAGQPGRTANEGNRLVNEGIKQFEVALRGYETARTLYYRQEMTFFETIIFLHSNQYGQCG